MVLDANDAEAARSLQAEANEVIALMIKYGNILSYSKAILRFMGFDCGDCRSPIPPLTEAQYTAFAEELRAQGILKEGGR